jgi:hypothetical protein
MNLSAAETAEYHRGCEVTRGRDRGELDPLEIKGETKKQGTVLVKTIY